MSKIALLVFFAMVCFAHAVPVADPDSSQFNLAGFPFPSWVTNGNGGSSFGQVWTSGSNMGSSGFEAVSIVTKPGPDGKPITVIQTNNNGVITEKVIPAQAN